MLIFGMNKVLISSIFLLVVNVLAGDVELSVLLD